MTWQALTRDEYLAHMEGRTRPLGDVMSNARSRIDADNSAAFGINDGRLYEVVKRSTHTERCDTPPDTDEVAQRRERNRYLAEQRNRRRTPGCGTNSGWRTHMRDGTPVCELCELAHQMAANQHNARRRSL